MLGQKRAGKWQKFDNCENKRVSQNEFYCNEIHPLICEYIDRPPLKVSPCVPRRRTRRGPQCADFVWIILCGGATENLPFAPSAPVFRVIHKSRSITHAKIGKKCLDNILKNISEFRILGHPLFHSGYKLGRITYKPIRLSKKRGTELVFISKPSAFRIESPCFGLSLLF